MRKSIPRSGTVELRNNELTPQAIQRSMPGDSAIDARLYVERSNQELELRTS